MEDAPVIDLGRAAELAITRMLEAGRVVGRDGNGRTIVEIAVDNWIVDWFGRPRKRHIGRRDRSAITRTSAEEPV